MYIYVTMGLYASPSPEPILLVRLFVSQIRYAGLLDSDANYSNRGSQAFSEMSRGLTAQSGMHISDIGRRVAIKGKLLGHASLLHT